MSSLGLDLDLDLDLDVDLDGLVRGKISRYNYCRIALYPCLSTSKSTSKSRSKSRKKAVASVTGIGGMIGAVAGILADYTLGQVLTASGPAGYFFAFMIAGFLYLVLLGSVHLLMPKMTPLDESLRHAES